METEMEMETKTEATLNEGVFIETLKNKSAREISRINNKVWRVTVKKNSPIESIFMPVSFTSSIVEAFRAEECEEIEVRIGETPYIPISGRSNEATAKGINELYLATVEAYQNNTLGEVFSFTEKGVKMNSYTVRVRRSQRHPQRSQ